MMHIGAMSSFWKHLAGVVQKKREHVFRPECSVSYVVAGLQVSVAGSHNSMKWESCCSMVDLTDHVSQEDVLVHLIQRLE